MRYVRKTACSKVSSSIWGPGLSPTRDKAVYPTITVDVPETCLRGYGVGPEGPERKLGPAGPTSADGSSCSGRGYDSFFLGPWTLAL